MLKAHRRAWLWQDEWYGLTMNDIREIERQTQEILRKKMAAAMGTSSVESIPGEVEEATQKQPLSQLRANDNLSTKLGSIEKALPDLEISTATSSKRR
jgi:hypothetical protein